uniref:F-box domain-containing protein n=1 Tax=Mycena chlorophos TaxID=658473 RepID=A0ABQ0LZN8_MYCCL|nr:predicted protein [Mycena chlorophos]
MTRSKVRSNRRAAALPMALDGQSSSSSFPPEICAVICEMLEPDRDGLIAVSTLTKAFRGEAQRVLFHTVDLTTASGSDDALARWCCSLSGRTRVGELVRVLVVELPPPPLASSARLGSESSLLATALRKCTNLTHFTMHHSRNDTTASGLPREWDDRALLKWLSPDCAARFTVFRLGYPASAGPRKQFWDKQTGIRLLSLAYVSGGPCPLRDEQLPALVGVEVSAIETLPVSRALQRIQLNLTGNKPTDSDWWSSTWNWQLRIPSPNGFSTTLTMLNIVFTKRNLSAVLVEGLPHLAESLPNLRCLGFKEERFSSKPAHMAGISQQSLQTPISSLAKHRRLETLVLCTYSVFALRWIDGATNHWQMLALESSAPDFGRAVMQSNPSVKRVVLGCFLRSEAAESLQVASPGGESEMREADLKAWLRKFEKTCTLEREAGSGGDATVTNGHGFEFERVTNGCHGGMRMQTGLRGRGRDGWRKKTQDGSLCVCLWRARWAGRDEATGSCEEVFEVPSGCASSWVRSRLQGCSTPSPGCSAISVASGPAAVASLPQVVLALVLPERYATLRWPSSYSVEYPPSTTSTSSGGATRYRAFSSPRPHFERSSLPSRRRQRLLGRMSRAYAAFAHILCAMPNPISASTA